MSSNEKNKEEKDDDLAESIEGLKDEIKIIEEKQDKILKTIGKRTTLILVSVTVAALLLYVLTTTPFVTNQQTTYTLRSNYEIEDLKGQKINTWVAWKIPEGDEFHIHVQDSPEVTDARMNLIENVIFSNDTVVMGNETYYNGWSGALQAAESRGTLYPIPIYFHKIATTDTGSGDILIKLSNLESGDGYAAYTKSITDAVNHQILKSEITVYEVDKLTDIEFSTVLKHELGHAFGLAHSSDPNDLMYQEISRKHMYISPCDVDALEQLYNGKEKRQITC